MPSASARASSSRCSAVRWRKLPEGPGWQCEVKLDGYRAIAVRTRTSVELWSRNKKDFSRRFPHVARALQALPGETVLDGEIVAMNADGQPSFSSLQNFGDGAAAILFYAFDVPVLAGADLRSKPRICGPNSERLHASFTSNGILEFRGSVDHRMPVSESSRIGKRQMGRGADRRRNEPMPLAEAATSRGDRVSRVDSRRAIFVIRSSLGFVMTANRPKSRGGEMKIQPAAVKDHEGVRNDSGRIDVHRVGTSAARG